MSNLEEMDKFLVSYNLPRLNIEELENQNRPITYKEVETKFKNPSANTSPGPYSFTDKFYKTFKEDLIAILKLFEKIKEEENFPNIFYIARITLSISDKCTTKIIKIRKIGSIYKILKSWIHWYIERIIAYSQVRFIPGVQDGSASSNQSTQYINKMKDKNCVIISKGIERASEKIQHPLMIKTLNKVVRVYMSQLNKSHIGQTHSQHHIWWWNAQSISSKMRNKTLEIFIQHSTGSCKHSNQENNKKGIQIWKEKVKQSQFANDILLYTVYVLEKC